MMTPEHMCQKKNMYVQSGTSLVAQMAKHLPTMREAWVRSLGQEDPLEKEMATRSRTLAWKIPWTEDPGRLQFKGSQRVNTTERSIESNSVARWTVAYQDSPSMTFYR